MVSCYTLFIRLDMKGNEMNKYFAEALVAEYRSQSGFSSNIAIIGNIKAKSPEEAAQKAFQKGYNTVIINGKSYTK